MLGGGCDIITMGAALAHGHGDGSGEKIMCVWCCLVLHAGRMGRSGWSAWREGYCGAKKWREISILAQYSLEGGEYLVAYLLTSIVETEIALFPHFSQIGTKAVCGFPYHSNRPTPLPYK